MTKTMKVKFTDEFWKTFRWPKGASAAQLETADGKKAEATKRTIGSFTGTEGTLRFGAIVKKEFVPLASQPTAEDIRKPEKGQRPARPAKAERKTGNGEGPGRLKTLFDASITSVIRCLASKGWESHDILNALRAKKIDVSPTTVYIQSAAGRKPKKDTPPPAKLTGEQVAELKELAKKASAKEEAEAEKEKAA